MTKPTGRPRGRPKTKEYVTLMARVPQELADRVQRYAGLHQQPISVVLRDALEVLLEEDRYQPFMADRNAVPDILSDRKEESADIASDRKEEATAITSDISSVEPAPQDFTPQRARSAKASDTKGAMAAILSYTKGDIPVFLSDTKEDERTSDVHELLPDNLSDTKEVQTANPPAPVFLSDTNVPAFDPSKYVLGKLCPRGHDYHDTGQSLRRLPKFVCLECDAERARERRQAQRQSPHR
jgi:hypothetical protein